MARETVDIFISGGGIAGLTAGIVMAREGFRTVLADPTPPATSRDDSGSDLRSTAFLQPARELLEDAGLWDRLGEAATPLEALRVIDLSGTPSTIQTERTFVASDLDQAAFGWNLPNWLTRKVLIIASRPRSKVSWINASSVTRWKTSTRRMTVARQKNARSQLERNAPGENVV